MVGGRGTRLWAADPLARIVVDERVVGDIRGGQGHGSPLRSVVDARNGNPVLTADLPSTSSGAEHLV